MQKSKRLKIKRTTLRNLNLSDLAEIAAGCDTGSNATDAASGGACTKTCTAPCC